MENFTLAQFINSSTMGIKNAKQRYELMNIIGALILNGFFESGQANIFKAIISSPKSMEQFKKELKQKKINFKLEIYEAQAIELKYVVNFNSIIVNGKRFNKTSRVKELLAKHDEKDIALLLARYWAIQMRKNGSSYQWAFPFQTKSVDLETIEAFASPLNVDSGRAFCSVFPEDGKFGSLGSFFKLDSSKYKNYHFLINPPFTEMILEAAAKIALGLDNFTFIMPNWTDSVAYGLLSNMDGITVTKKINATYINPDNGDRFNPKFTTVIFEFRKVKISMH